MGSLIETSGGVEASTGVQWRWCSSEMHSFESVGRLTSDSVRPNSRGFISSLCSAFHLLIPIIPIPLSVSRQTKAQRFFFENG